MIFLACAPSNSGKTHLVREWLVPTLLWRPDYVSDAAPARFRAALILDPPSPRRPDGQYPGQRFRDVAEFRRTPAGRRARVVCFSAADTRELVRLALELGDVVLVLDEIDLAMPSRAYQLSDAETELVQRGRHSGVALVGTCRRLHDVNSQVRGNVQVAWFGNLADPEDRLYAAKTCGIEPARLVDVPPRIFLEWDRARNFRCLTRLEGSRKITLENL